MYRMAAKVEGQLKAKLRPAPRRLPSEMASSANTQTLAGSRGSKTGVSLNFKGLRMTCLERIKGEEGDTDLGGVCSATPPFGLTGPMVTLCCVRRARNQLSLCVSRLLETKKETLTLGVYVALPLRERPSPPTSDPDVFSLFRLQGSGFMVQCLGFGVWGLGLRVEGLGFGV